MKKFTKGMLIAAGIFGAVGIGLTAAGGVMGASMSELTGVKSLKRVLLVADGDYDYDDSDDYDDDDDYDDYDYDDSDDYDSDDYDDSDDCDDSEKRGQDYGTGPCLLPDAAKPALQDTRPD